MQTQLFHSGCLDCSLLPPSRRSVAQCCVPSACSRRTSLWSIWCDLQVALSAPTFNVGVNLFFQCVLLNFCCANIPQSLSPVVAQRFGSFTTSTEGRSPTQGDFYTIQWNKHACTCLCAQAHSDLYFFMTVVLVIIPLFPKLPCDVNSNCLWQKMNPGSVLLTSTISSFSGGFTLFSCRACQLMTRKNAVFWCCQPCCNYPIIRMDLWTKAGNRNK